MREKQEFILTKLEELENITLPISSGIVFLYGNLGAGKTSFVQSQLARLGFDDVTSPTYVYYNTYGDNYHFDLYRQSDYEEFVSIGGEEILDNATGLVFIEWPQNLEPFYTPDLIIRIDLLENGTRKIELI